MFSTAKTKYKFNLQMIIMVKSRFIFVILQKGDDSVSCHDYLGSAYISTFSEGAKLPANKLSSTHPLTVLFLEGLLVSCLHS